MKIKSDDLALAEWAFFVEKKEYLDPKYQDEYWIPKDEVGLVCEYEYARTNYHRGGESLGWGFYAEEFKKLIKKPFVELNKVEKKRIKEKRCWEPGLFGNTAIPTFMDQESTPTSEWSYWIHINWLLDDQELLPKFKQFLEKNRPRNFPNRGVMSKKRTDRDRLKYLAAYRLRKHYLSTKTRTIKTLPSFIQGLYNVSVVVPGVEPFYSQTSTMIAGSNKAEEELNILFRSNEEKKLHLPVDPNEIKGFSSGKTYKVFGSK